MTLKEALKRIEELEHENEELRNALAIYNGHKPSGRKVHDDKWTSSYNDFVVQYEAGKSIAQIVENSEYSRRTAYRYKEYYDKLKGLK